jgi:hypothetical protein
MIAEHGPTLAAGCPDWPGIDRRGSLLSLRIGKSSGFGRFDVPGRLPLPRQQCLEFVPFGAPGYDAFKYIGEPGQRFDAVQFCALDEGRNDRPVPSAAVISGKKRFYGLSSLV